MAIDRVHRRSAWRALVALLLGALMVLSASAARAKDDAGAGEKKEEAEKSEKVAPDSPRVSLERFLDLTRDGANAEAAAYLAAAPGVKTPRADLARRLKAVLDRHAWIDLQEISGDSAGNREDGLALDVEQVATIPVAGGGSEPVRLSRNAGQRRWVFSRATVERIDTWYSQLENRWFADHLPQPLLKTGPKDLPWWQWLALPALLFTAAVAGWIVSWLIRRIFAAVTRRTSTPWDNAVLDRMGGPLTVALTLAIAAGLLPLLGVHASAEHFAQQVIRAGFLADFFWALARVIDVGAAIVQKSSWTVERGGSRALIQLATRVGKIVVLTFAVVAFLSELGYPVASLIAGLGIGGLAFALAAQKTVENLFGAFSIGADQPFREGDFVKIEDFVGTVEQIGLRSTRIRTLDRTLITIPNGKLADMRLESFAARDRIRLACTVGLVYETTSAQMRTILAELERVLRAHPRIWPDAVVVRFKEFGASSLDIEIMAWFQTSDWGEFQLIRQGILLEFMEVVEKNGSSFAFPTRTVHLVGDSPKA